MENVKTVYTNSIKTPEIIWFFLKLRWILPLNMSFKTGLTRGCLKEFACVFWLLTIKNIKKDKRQFVQDNTIWKNMICAMCCTVLCRNVQSIQGMCKSSQ